jgi:hypothetical protein
MTEEDPVCRLYTRVRANNLTPIIDLPESAIDLSKATKLKDVEFTFGLRPRLLITTLRTVTRDHRELEQISLAVISARGLYDQSDVRSGVGEVAYQQWLELDRIMTRLNESHPVRLKINCNKPLDPDGSKERNRMEVLLPEAMARGIVDIVSS